MAKEINAGLQIVYRKLSEMHPNPKNPRKQGDDGIVPLAESIEANPQFFEARPILLSDRTGKLVIIGGERRWEAAQYLEMENAPSILFHGLTEEQEDEIMTRDNTHAGVWDEAKLKAWPNELLEKWGAPKWKDTEFKPNLNPIEGTKLVSDEDIEKAKENIESALGATASKTIEVVCPHCGEKFIIKA